MKYTAINIGPIIKTLGMARKPRELWAASYMFSYLMKCIVEALPKATIISPSIFTKDEKNGIGLYPDRLFLKDSEVAYDTILKPVVSKFAGDLKVDADYFNVMVVSGDYEKDSEAIKDLNYKLDCMELFNMATDRITEDKVRELIGMKYGSKLFEDALGTKDFPIETLGEIAAIELCQEEGLKQFVKDIKSDDNKVSEKAYNNLPKDKLKSYHKYICVVQADGDNVGKTVSHSQLPDGKVKEISTSLLEFGNSAKKTIKDFGGLPIYAGGDDLLFIAPVVGKDLSNIFQLLNKLNDESFDCVKKVVAGCGLKYPDDYDKPEGHRMPEDKKTPIKASLSFGVSITYYKYPLYEALESARNLLFDKAKKVDGKNAVVVDWRKHSGGAFTVQFSKSKEDLQNAFTQMIEASSKSVDESVVSAVAHKIRENEGLLSLWMGDGNIEQRNNNFFQKYLEYNPNKEEDKKSASDKYKDAAFSLLNELFKTETDISILTQTMYGMLRMAKFIKGEEVKDE